MGKGIKVAKSCIECKVKDICSKNYCAMDAYEEVAARLVGGFWPSTNTQSVAIAQIAAVLSKYKQFHISESCQIKIDGGDLRKLLELSTV